MLADILYVISCWTMNPEMKLMRLPCPGMKLDFPFDPGRKIDGINLYPDRIERVQRVQVSEMALQYPECEDRVVRVQRIQRVQSCCMLGPNEEAGRLFACPVAN